MLGHLEVSFILFILLSFISKCLVRSEELTYIDIDEELNDDAAEKAIKEMMGKLEKALDLQSLSCQNDEVPPRPCLDLTSGQSVLTQLCDRITSLESRLKKVSSVVTSAHNSNSKHNDSPPAPQIDKLKSEIDTLKRSSAFYASRTDTLGNFTHDKIRNYMATVNSGVNFDPSDGVFKAPFEGVYHFALSYQKTPEIDLEAHLIVDSEIIAAAQDEEKAHIDILTSLRSGQEVWTDLTTNSIPVDSKVTFTFSGFLVH